MSDPAGSLAAMTAPRHARFPDVDASDGFRYRYLAFEGETLAEALHEAATFLDAADGDGDEDLFVVGLTFEYRNDVAAGDGPVRGPADRGGGCGDEGAGPVAERVLMTTAKAVVA